MNAERLEIAAEEFKKQFGKDSFTTVDSGCNKHSQIKDAFATAILAFGGVDLIVNNAGFRFQKPSVIIRKKIGICYMMYW